MKLINSKKRLEQLRKDSIAMINLGFDKMALLWDYGETPTDVVFRYSLQPIYKNPSLLSRVCSWFKK